MMALALKVTVVFLMALALQRAFRSASASVRHLVWAVAVGTALALPVATTLTPGVPVSGLRGPRLTIPALTLPALTLPASTSDPSEMAAADERYAGGAVPTTESPLPSSVVSGGDRDRSAGKSAGISPILAIWGVGAGLVLLWLSASWVRVWRAGREATPFDEAWVQSVGRRLALELGLRSPPPLLRGPAHRMPATLGVFRPSIMLPAGAEAWERHRLEAVLAHELAHVRRWDCAVQLLAGLACALYWYHPLAWLAARRLRVEREFACDDEVIRRGMRPSRYAACLLDLARASMVWGLPSAVSTAVAQPGGLPDRIRAVLSDRGGRRPLTRRGALGAVALGLTLVVPLSALRAAAPQEGFPVAIQEAEDPFGCWIRSVPRDMSVRTHESGWEILRESAVCRSEIRVRPPIEFPSDFSWIAGLGDGALVRVDETVGGVQRKVEFRPDAGGVGVAFWRDGTPSELDADARRWITARVRTVLRQTGLAADLRVARILDGEGVDEVLAEVEIISLDDPQSLYLVELLDQAELSAPEVDRTLDVATRLVGSDGSLAPVLTAVARGHRDRILNSAREAFLEAAKRVGSDGVHVEMLERLVRDADGEDRAIRAAVLALALESAADAVGSDGDMADFLIGIGRRHAELLEEPEVDARFRRAFRTVGSDGEEARIREALGMGRR